MEPRKLTEMTAAMILANMTPERAGDFHPRPFGPINNPKHKPSGKDRSKIKAGRKQNKVRKGGAS